MNKKSQNQTVAKAIRVEHNPDSDSVYLVFEITDEDFKKRIKHDWTEDIELKVVGKDLVPED